MIPLASVDEMRAAERRLTEEIGMPSLLLMENAGRGAADVIERAFGAARGRHVLVLCGRGSNGGDGLVVARHLLARGARVDVWVVGGGTGAVGDAGVNLAVATRAGVEVREAEGGPGALRAALAAADVVVDGLLGTGARGGARGAVAEAIEAINAAARPVCALDLPSGLSADDGAAPGPTVRATLTVTFGLPKRGLFLREGPAHAGRVEVADLGVPRDWLATRLAVSLLEAADVRAVLPGRPAEAHKGRYGHLLVVAGSLGKAGAAVLACRGALRGGTGLVTAAVPASQQPVAAAQLAEAMTEPLAETASRTIARAAVDRVLALAARMDAIALGPGLGLDPGTQEAARDLARGAERPMVIDADALTALAGHLASLRTARGPRLLTPHPGEAARLLGCATGEVQRDRVGSARRLAGETGAVVALKGAWTVVASPDGEATLNPTGNPGMATGGMGDVLTGVAGGLLAQGLDPAAALRAAVYLHGLAGDLAASARGGAGLLAGDVADALPQAAARVREAQA